MEDFKLMKLRAEIKYKKKLLKEINSTRKLNFACMVILLINLGFAILGIIKEITT